MRSWRVRIMVYSMCSRNICTMKGLVLQETSTCHQFPLSLLISVYQELEKTKIRPGDSLTHLSSIREWLLPEDVPSRQHRKHYKIAFQLFVVTKLSLVPFYELSIAFTVSQAWGNSVFACILKNNSYWLCFSDFANSPSFQTLLIGTHLVSWHFLFLLQFAIAFPNDSHLDILIRFASYVFNCIFPKG